jgi:hypothetical protein
LHVFRVAVYGDEAVDRKQFALAEGRCPMTTLSISRAVAYPSIATALVQSGSKPCAAEPTFASAILGGSDRAQGTGPSSTVQGSGVFGGTVFGGTNVAMPMADATAHVPADMTPARPWRLPPRESTRL